MDSTRSKTLPALGAAFLAIGCSAPAPPGAPGAVAPTPTRPSTTTSPPQANSDTHAPPEMPEPASRAPIDTDAGLYTALEGDACTLVSVDREAGGSTQRCPGVHGYQLLVQDGDARMSVDVIAPGGKTTPLQLSSLVGNGAFSSLGPRAEWRPSDASTPTALVVRFNAFQQPEQPDRPTSYLVVAKLAPGQPCVVGRIEPGPGQNQRAREMAAKAGPMACLQPGGR